MYAPFFGSGIKLKYFLLKLAKANTYKINPVNWIPKPKKFNGTKPPRYKMEKNKPNLSITKILENAFKLVLLTKVIACILSRFDEYTTN